MCKSTVLALILVLAGTHDAAFAQPASTSPNFVIIMADDLGYGDISPYDGWIDTPHLQKMADEGMRFTNFYASGPVCSPTRAGLLTGRYQQRAGIHGVVYADPSKNRHHGLQTAEYTVAEAFKAAGYKTGMFGKWHLGYQPQYNPVHHGFDTFRGYVSGNVDYFAHIDQAGFYDWWSQDQLVNEPGYVTHLITQHAVSFIEANKDDPFVLYLPHEAPHYPFQGPDDEGFRIVHQQVPEKRDSVQIRRAYREMVEEMDAGIGEVMQTLERLNLDENTVVLFFSDNGAARYGSNGPFRGWKGSLWEGGIRVPALAWWKGKIEAGSSTDQMAITLDIFPTMLGLAELQARQPAFDGIDLSPFLTQQKQGIERTLFWAYGKQMAMRDGSWKLVKGIDDTGATGLYNLADTRDESVDLSARFPEKTAAMLASLVAWRKETLQHATPQPDN